MDARRLLSPPESFEFKVAGLFTEPEKTMVIIAPVIRKLDPYCQNKILGEVAITQMRVERTESSYANVFSAGAWYLCPKLSLKQNWFKLEVYYGKDVAEYGVLPLSQDGPFPKRVVIIKWA